MTDPPTAREMLEPGVVRGEWWHRLENGKVQCDVCPRHCRLSPGQRGFCFVRQERGGGVALTSYGRASGFCIDPIEKKPLNHFYPGTSVLSFGTAGCNLGCKFCQNWDISKARQMDRLMDWARPESVAEATADAGCKSIAFTYNDPTIFAEYAIDCAQAAHERGIQAVAVSAGYIGPETRKDFYRHMDAANIDLKAFSQQFYRRLCFAELEPVLETLCYLRHETEVWFEVTTLLIPQQNDSDDELKRLCHWFASHLGPDVPLHFTAFHPDFKMSELPCTPVSTLRRARGIALAEGLRFVYTGNVHDVAAQSTYCPGCRERVIERDWYELGLWNLDSESRCRSCGCRLPGRFDSQPGGWGARRQRVVVR